MAHLHLADGWRLAEDGELQWILQRENPKAKEDRNRWRPVAFCGTREGLLEVALPHKRCSTHRCRLLRLKLAPDPL